MNKELERNDEATARQLRSTLMEKYSALNVSHKAPGQAARVGMY